MKINRRNPKNSLLKGFTAAIISAPLTYFLLDIYAALTVSLGNGEVISQMIEGAVIVTSGITFLTATSSSYMEIES